MIKKITGFLKSLYVFYRNMSLKKKLPILSAVQIFIPIFTISTLSFIVIKEVVKNNAINHSRDIVSSINMRLTDFCNNVETISQNILYERELHDVLINDKIKEEQLSYYENMNNVSRILQKFTISNNEIQYIGLISNNKNYYYTSGNIRKNSVDDLPYNLMLAQARDMKGYPSWFVYWDGTSNAKVYMIRTLHDDKTFRELGLLFIAVKSTYLQELCKYNYSYNIGDVAIVSNNMRLITGSSAANAKLLNEVKIEKNGVNTYHDTLIVSSSLENIPWRVMCFIPTSVVYKDINLLGLWLILFSVISLLLVLLLSIFSVHDILTPIQKLMSAMNKNRSEQTTKVVMGRNDEFGILGEHFNKMITDIKELRIVAYQENILRKDMQMKALQAQINPHFLFNTFETVNWIALMNGMPEISKIITSLAKIMSASMGKVNKIITLEEELSYIDGYIYIQKYRYGEKLQVNKEINNELLNVTIPPLIIQPLVENAIIHANENTDGVCVITIKIDLKGENVLIEVSDNGPGISRDRLEDIGRKIEDVDFSDDIKTGERVSIGLNNVNKRIKLNYGKDYGLNINSVEGEYTRVEIVIPKNCE